MKLTLENEVVLLFDLSPLEQGKTTLKLVWRLQNIFIVRKENSGIHG